MSVCFSVFVHYISEGGVNGFWCHISEGERMV